MNIVFYVSAVVAVIATALAITRLRPVHALLNLIVSLMAVALIFFVLGAPFVAALEVIVYAGAIVILFVYVVMMLNLGESVVAMERRWLPARAWIAPSIMALVLLGEVGYVIMRSGGNSTKGVGIAPEEVGAALFGPYIIGVELSSMLLLAGIVGAFHLARRDHLEPEITEER